MKYKRARKDLKNELREIDYWGKLTHIEKEFLTKFMFEYYQGDFDPDAIHPKALHKDCKDREQRHRRQLHAVDAEEVKRRAVSAQQAQNNPRTANRYYTPYDYKLGVPYDATDPVTETEDEYFQAPIEPDSEIL